MVDRVSECMLTQGSEVRRLRGDDLLRFLNVGTAQEWAGHRTMWRELAERAVSAMCEAPT